MAVAGLKAKMSCGNITKLGCLLRLKAPKLGLLAPLQTAFISGKIMRDNTIVKPPPFPYKEKTLRMLTAYLETTTKRFDENTKLVVVDGSIAVGKTTFAKALAEELDMLYVPENTPDEEYINSYGYDIRDYKHLIPEHAQPFDIADYYNNPHHKLSALLQLSMYQVRFSRYIDVLVHILNTGQGVVMDRSVYSDFCFLETMHHFKYISTPARNYYYEVKENTIGELLRPHLVIYLDAPVDVLMDRIKKRGHEYEVNNTEVLSLEYLQVLADVHKKKYLKAIEKHSELLIYDWSNFGDIEVVVEDIERIDFDHYDKYGTKMSDWLNLEEREWRKLRFEYTRGKNFMMALFNVPNLYAPELTISSPDAEIYWDVYASVPGNRFEKGYNAGAGDKSIVFKTKSPTAYP